MTQTLVTLTKDERKIRNAALTRIIRHHTRTVEHAGIRPVRLDSTQRPLVTG